MGEDSSRKVIGSLGEDIACRFLRSKGYKILAKNYRKPWGEIDIIAEKGTSVRFVEVKTVSRERLGHEPEELVDARKLRKIARTAELYMEVTNP
jgi:putative endonuclease